MFAAFHVSIAAMCMNARTEAFLAETRRDVVQGLLYDRGMSRALSHQAVLPMQLVYQFHGVDVPRASKAQAFL
jgi:hypothetical protein